ncbi:Zn-ribbon domain-containing OB-fold protein [Thalassovita sp.]|uniref:Zn-ribbon domain-containing OB-fold protein n=1 Tax=Thalassovita sp. TaxID=1979401 RepID=UPI0029DE8286|nr:OB-fold domain-containing protein [Thalassovita sp.]
MSFPTPEITEINRPYWDGLQAGELRYQNCRACGNKWLPARRYCPGCLADAPEWVIASGRGRVVSWVVYHRAYASYFEDKVPYDVTIVELDEGPRLLTNIVNSQGGTALHPGARVLLDIVTEAGVALAKFRLATPEEGQ